MFFFFFSSRRRHTRLTCDWSSDVCSSDLERRLHPGQDVVDAAEVDVAGDRAALRPLEVDLGGLAVLEDGDAALADVDRDEQFALRCGKRSAALRFPAPAGRLVAAALLPLGKLPD